MTMDQHENLGRYFGELHRHPAIPGPEGHPDILMLHSDAKHQGAASAWHSDVSCDQIPNLGSILYGKVIPEAGGDTCWASMYAAYDALSESMQQFLSGLTGIHEKRARLREDQGVGTELSERRASADTYPSGNRAAGFVRQ